MLGFLWCCAGIPLTVIGGAACQIVGDNSTDANVTVTVQNTCYYDIEGDKAYLYKSMAIGLIVVHVFSVFYFIIHMCPLKSIEDKVRNDPTPNTAAAASEPASSNNTAASSSSASAPPAVAATGASGTSPLTAKNVMNNDAIINIEKKIAELEKFSKQMSRREQELAKREKEIMNALEIGQYPPPLPPSYADAVRAVSVGQQPPPQPSGSLPPIE